jgi:hypothetical protein
MPTIRSYLKRLEALRSERSSFIPLYRELSDYHLAHRGRFLVSDRNKGHKRNTKQINNTSRLSARTLASGMMSGITSPARPWFRLSSGDSQLDDIPAVKFWLHEVQTSMYQIYSASNFYNSIHQVYSELGVFGTAAMGIFKDFDDVIWCRPYTVGSYFLGMNSKNMCDTLYREYQLTVGQVIKQFGIENVSAGVKKSWDDGNTEAWIDVVHAIEPNDNRDNTSVKAADKPFRSAYFERNTNANLGQDKFLRQSGFDEFPITTPRWDIVGEDIYAVDCPGISALGDTKALQLAEKRKYQAIDKLVSPPLQGPTALKAQMKGNQLTPNQIIWFDIQGKLESVYGNYRPDINVIKDEITNVENRVQETFYKDLFLMLANTDRRQITAREVAEKHEEKLLMLGPVLERLHTELLDPAIDRTFNIAQRNGIFPPPPPELQQTELDIEYVSVLAQAQRLVNTGAIDRITAFTAEAAAFWPNARHKININQAIDEYANALGVDPAIIVSDGDADAAAQVEAQAAQMAQQIAASEQIAGIAKTASETELSPDSALGAAATAAGVGQ